MQSLHMRLIYFLSGATACLLAEAAAHSEPPPLARVGEEYEITQSYETEEVSSDGSSASSSGHDTLLERVTAIRPDGLELFYDLPRGASAEDRAREWKFPARVFRSSDGSMQLLNQSELETRLETWLKAANWTREICGHWIFTWNAFRIDCDPQSVIPAIRSYDLRRNDLRDGAPFKVPEARTSGILRLQSTGRRVSTFATLLEIDPQSVLRARADSDVAAGEIMKKPITLEAALSKRSKEAVSGTVSVTIEVDPGGAVRRLTKITKIRTKLPDGEVKTQNATESVERQLVSSSSTDQ